MHLITSPVITPFLYNPARYSVDDFQCHFVGKSERPCMTYGPENKKACFIMFGRVNESSIMDLRMMGNGPWHNRSISIFPIAPEISLAYNFFSHFIKGHNLYNYGGYINFSTFPTSVDKGVLF